MNASRAMMGMLAIAAFTASSRSAYGDLRGYASGGFAPPAGTHRSARAKLKSYRMKRH